MTKEILGEEWFELLKPEFDKEYWHDLMATLVKEYGEYKIYPAPDQVFNALSLCPPSKTKVVFLSQDPYPHDAAHGLAFSSQKADVPYSLRVIFREIDRSIWKTASLPEYKSKVTSNNLTCWAKQGVMLLNSVLTVRANNSNSHANIGWEQFTAMILTHLWYDTNPKVFCLWGGSAQATFNSIRLQARDRHSVLTSGHPASGSHGKDMFSGNNHFIKINDFLKKTGQSEINWEVHEDSSNRS
jgi:uracil-DNA glycosylase